MRIALAVVVSMVACKGSSEEPPAVVASGSAVAAPPIDAAIAEDMNEKMRHCPVTLPGVTPVLEDTATGVRFTLTTKTPGDVAELRRRAQRLVDFSAGRSGKGQHGGGKGGGFMRNCPIVTKDTKIVAHDIAGGVTIDVTPNDAGTLADFRTRSHERFERAPIERAAVVREETSDAGDTRLFSAGVADLDGNGSMELVAGGFSAAAAGGRRSTVLVYRQRGADWLPLTEHGWDGGVGSTVRNIQLADVDGDGKPEVVALGRAGATEGEAKARLVVLALVADKLETRADTEWSAATYTHGFGLAIGDVDGDGKPEIVTGGFQGTGTAETGFVRVWSLAAGKLESRGEVTLDSQGAGSMRVNDLAIGDLDRDGSAEIVVVGRHGPFKQEGTNKKLDERRELGDLSVLAFTGGKLVVRTRYSWAKATSLRLRSVAIADLDGDGKLDIVTGGQYDADGKVCLARFGFVAGKLVLQDDASTTTDGVAGEIKDLVIVGTGAELRVLATGPTGEQPGRHGDLAAWRLDHGKLVRDAAIVSRNADETRARAVVVVPDGTVLTIGHAKKGQTAMVGQVLRWKLALPKPR